MAGELELPSNDSFKLSNDAKSAIETTMIMFTLTQLAAEIASINRTAIEADEFISDLKEKLNDFAEKANTQDNPIDRAWKKEMQSFIKLVLGGISFQKNKS